VARVTSLAITQNREWSSMPEMSLASVPSASITEPMMSSCHSSIGTGRSQRV
jgi:hypothetical protein